jgi:hypothetical protein
MRSLVLALLIAYAAPAQPRSIAPEALSPARLNRISARYLGTPYKLDCLGEGNGPDAGPLFTRKACDCQTLVEQVLAEALAPYVGGLDAAVRRMRYHRGEVKLEERFHYCVPDWLENPWPAVDVTTEVGKREEKALTRRIARAELLKSRGAASVGSLPEEETVTTTYIPRSRIANVASRIPDGSILLFVTSDPRVVVGHMGFAFRKNRTLLFRHASQTRHKVVEEPLTGYLARAPRRFIGLKVLRPDASRLGS